MPEGDGRSGPLNVEGVKKNVGRETTTTLTRVDGAKAPRRRPKQAVQPALMTIDEAATRLALSGSMLRKMIGAGQLKAVRIGRSVRLRVEDVEAVATGGA